MLSKADHTDIETGFSAGRDINKKHAYLGGHNISHTGESHDNYAYIGDGEHTGGTTLSPGKTAVESTIHRGDEGVENSAEANGGLTPCPAVSTRKPPTDQRDRGWAWVVLGSCFMIQLCSLATLDFTSGVFLSSWMEIYDENVAMINLAMSAAPIACGLSSLPVAMIIPKLGCRLSVMGGGLVECLAYIGAAYSLNIWVMIAYLSVAGVAMSFIYTPTYIILTDYFNKHISIAISVASLGYGVGGLIMPLLAENLQLAFNTQGPHFSTSSAMLILSGIVLQVCVCGAVLRHYKYDPRVQVDDRMTPATAITRTTSAEHPERISNLQHVSTGAPKRNVLIVKFAPLYNAAFFAIGSSFFLSQCSSAIITLHLARSVELQGFSGAQSSLILSLVSAASLPTRVVLGVVADVYPHSRRIIYITAGTVAAVFTIVRPSLTAYYSLVGYSLGLGMVVNQFEILFPLLVTDNLGSEVIGVASGFLVVCDSTSFAVSIVGAMLYEETGTYDVTFYFCGCLFLTSGLLIACLYPLEKYQRRNVGTTPVPIS